MHKSHDWLLTFNDTFNRCLLSENLCHSFRTTFYLGKSRDWKTFIRWTIFIFLISPINITFLALLRPTTTSQKWQNDVFTNSTVLSINSVIQSFTHTHLLAQFKPDQFTHRSLRETKFGDFCTMFAAHCCIFCCFSCMA